MPRCSGCGFDRVVVRDAHDSARNLLPELLPEQARVYRGWTGDPYGMLSGLDGSFSGVVFTGFHSPAHSGGSPLAHTMDTGLYEVRLNGRIASEFLLNAYAAARIGVPGPDADRRLRHLLRRGKGASHVADSLHAGRKRRRHTVTAPARGDFAHRAHGCGGSDARVRRDSGTAATARFLYDRSIV